VGRGVWDELLVSGVFSAPRCLVTFGGGVVAMGGVGGWVG
jgi:hypothetical protein